jgi:hypothetical protein
MAPIGGQYSAVLAETTDEKAEPADLLTPLHWVISSLNECWSVMRSLSRTKDFSFFRDLSGTGFFGIVSRSPDTSASAAGITEQQQKPLN